MPQLDPHTQTVRSEAPHTPRRFAPDVPASRRAALKLLRGLPRGTRAEPTLDQWRHLARGLTLGDPPADDLVAEMAGQARAVAWQRFELALTRGVDAVPDATPALRAFFAHVSKRPTWVDPTKLRRGARVCALGSDEALAGLLVNALAAGYQFSAINQTLIATGQLSASASRRLGHTTQWFMDVTEDDALERFSAGFLSTLRVRLIHALVRRRLLANGWDVSRWGMPVNQVDMQATYLGFGPVYLLGMQLLGGVTTARERAAYVHRWRYLAWLNGVREDYLHALGDEETHARVLLYQNILQQPLADESSAALARPLLLDEPLSRNYGRGQRLRGSLTRAKQLSIASVSMGWQGMAELGLPRGATPWYPLLRFAVNQPKHRLARALPGGRRWLARRGRAQQQRALAQVASGAPELAHGTG